MNAVRIPRLETDRLTLREWQAADIDAYAAMLADPEVARWLGGTNDRAASWRSMSMHAGHWPLRGYGTWAVVRRTDGVLVGRVGLWYPDGWPGLEIGWTLARHAWGCGYATEAARGAMQWAWTMLAPERLISLIDPANVASARVAQRVGLSPDGEVMLRGQRVTVFAIDRPGDLDQPSG